VLEQGSLFANRFRIERPLAEGGMGAVFVATNVGTKKPVAIKVLTHRSEFAIESFKFEATVAARVETEHVVDVIDIGQDEETGLHYIVMELLRGSSLEDLVREKGRMAGEEVVAYVRQIANGLDAVHKHIDEDGQLKPIVHRDLKPANVFRSSRPDGSPLLKILDFGLAKRVSKSVGISREVRGSFFYIAPEQINLEELSERTDVWALGLIAFFLLAGREYWKSASAADVSEAAIFHEIVNVPMPTASDRFRELEKSEPPWPGRFDAWFAKAVHRRPHQRYWSAGEAAEMLSVALLDRVSIPVPPEVRAGPHDRTVPTSGPERAVERDDNGKNPFVAGGTSRTSFSASSPSSPLVPRKFSWLAAGAGSILLVLIGLAFAQKRSLDGRESYAASAAPPAATDLLIPASPMPSAKQSDPGPIVPAAEPVPAAPTKEPETTDAPPAPGSNLAKARLTPRTGFTPAHSRSAPTPSADIAKLAPAPIASSSPTLKGQRGGVFERSNPYQ
jgi:eukaryotic-like serine/threonine-protein kinase